MEKSDEPYSRFHDETPISTISGSSPPPMYSPSQDNSSVDQQQVENCPRTKRLATVGMVVSCLLLLFGIITTILGNTHDQPFWGREMGTSCSAGTSAWVPILGIIAAGLGLGSLRYGNQNNKDCFLISYFIMCIVSALASFVLIIFTCFCMANASDFLDPSNAALITFEVFVLLGALTNMIVFIVSSSFMCEDWCGKTNGACSTVVCIPSHLASGNGERPISVPPGAQVIFLPSNIQENVPAQTNAP